MQAHTFVAHVRVCNARATLDVENNIVYLSVCAYVCSDSCMQLNCRGGCDKGASKKGHRGRYAY